MIAGDGGSAGSLRGFTVGMSMQPSQLERILSYIPAEPGLVQVSLWGGFDYSSALSQAEEVVKGVKLIPEGGLKLRLEYPTKQNVLDIYITQVDIFRSGVRAEEFDKVRRVQLEKAEWVLPSVYTPEVTIALTPWEALVEVRDVEPDYVAQMKGDPLIESRVKVRKYATQNPEPRKNVVHLL